VPSYMFEYDYSLYADFGELATATIHLDLKKSISLVDENYRFTPVVEKIEEEHESLFTMELTPACYVAKPGETKTYTVTIHNTYAKTTTYEISILTEINTTWITLSASNVTIPSQSSANVSLEITLPSDLALMQNVTYLFEVKVKSDYAILSVITEFSQTAKGRLTVSATKESKIIYIITETDSLIATLTGMDMPQGIKNSLMSKLEEAKEKLEDALIQLLEGDENDTNDKLEDVKEDIIGFVNEVEAQRGKKVSEEDADTLSTAGQTLITHIDETIDTPI